MRIARLAWLALLVAPLTASCIGAGHSVNAYGGTRSLDTNDLGSLDDQTVYGADVVLKIDLPMLAMEGGWLHAEESDDSVGGLTNVDFASDEYFVGLRLVPWDILISPYASAGVSYVDSDLDATGTSDSDTVLGYYARLGAAFNLGIFRFGLDGRWLFGSDVELDTIDTDLDNVQLTAFVGIGF